jgi:hypothetical protein
VRVGGIARADAMLARLIGDCTAKQPAGPFV